MFTDIHCHVIPGVDDGPKTLEQALELCRLAVNEGCDKLIATPHFYASRHGLAERLAHIEESFFALKEAVGGENIPLSLARGVEVRYFSGISRSESLDKLCLGNSRYLLLELDSEPITDKIIDDITELGYCGFDVILAHIERYFKVPGYKKIKSLLAGGGVLSQVTATSFLEAPFIKPSMSLLKSDLVTFVAGDMHSVDKRPPRMAEAFRLISAKQGKSKVEKLILNSNELFLETIKCL